MAALPPRRQMLVQDTALGFALAAVNVFSVLPYHDQLHPLALALALLAAQGLFLAGRRIWPRARDTGRQRGADRLRPDRLRLRPDPARPGHRAVHRDGPQRHHLALAHGRPAPWPGITVSLLAPGHHEPYDAIYQGMIFLTAAIAGLLARARRATIRPRENRAARAEAELDDQAARAAMAERTRIARELHDVVAHHVSLIAVQSEAVPR